MNGKYDAILDLLEENKDLLDEIKSLLEDIDDDCDMGEDEYDEDEDDEDEDEYDEDEDEADEKDTLVYEDRRETKTYPDVLEVFGGSLDDCIIGDDIGLPFARGEEESDCSARYIDGLISQFDRKSDPQTHELRHTLPIKHITHGPYKRPDSKRQTYQNVFTRVLKGVKRIIVG